MNLTVFMKSVEVYPFAKSPLSDVVAAGAIPTPQPRPPVLWATRQRGAHYVMIRRVSMIADRTTRRGSKSSLREPSAIYTRPESQVRRRLPPGFRSPDTRVNAWSLSPTIRN
jgi:hypothetical protein